MVTEDGAPSRPQPATGERAARRAQHVRVLRGVDCGPVVEGIGVRACLDPAVALAPADGADGPALEHGEGVGQLVVLVVVDQVAALNDEVGTHRTDSGCGAGEHLARQRLLGTERRLKRRPEAIEERHSGRRGWVEDVGVGDVRERRDHAARSGTSAELDSVKQRLAGSDPELAVADRIGPRGAKRRPGFGR